MTIFIIWLLSFTLGYEVFQQLLCISFFVLVLSMTLNRMSDNPFIFQTFTALPSVARIFSATITNMIRKTFLSKPNQLIL